MKIHDHKDGREHCKLTPDDFTQRNVALINEVYAADFNLLNYTMRAVRL
jgi:hypothetical protein